MCLGAYVFSHSLTVLLAPLCCRLCLIRSSRLSLLGTGIICRYSPLLLLFSRAEAGVGHPRRGDRA